MIGGNAPWASCAECRARPICLRLLAQVMRAADSRTFWTAGRSRPMRTAMMAITTNSSMSVKPIRRMGRVFMGVPPKVVGVNGTISVIGSGPGPNHEAGGPRLLTPPFCERGKYGPPAAGVASRHLLRVLGAPSHRPTRALFRATGKGDTPPKGVLSSPVRITGPQERGGQESCSRGSLRVRVESNHVQHRSL